MVLYQDGAYASANIHGTIAGAGAGEVARLYAQPFPYKKAATAVAAVTLKASKAYFALSLSTSGTPEPPTTLTVNGGKAIVSKSTRLSATQYEFTFTVGGDGYAWLWNACSKDTLAKDGIGLPGSHSCGAAKVPASTLYLG